MKSKIQPISFCLKITDRDERPDLYRLPAPVIAEGCSHSSDDHFVDQVELRTVDFHSEDTGLGCRG